MTDSPLVSREWRQRILAGLYEAAVCPHHGDRVVVVIRSGRHCPICDEQREARDELESVLRALEAK